MTQGYIPRAHARFQHLGYSRFAMVFVMEACSSAIFQKKKKAQDTLDMKISYHQVYLFSPK